MIRGARMTGVLGLGLCCVASNALAADPPAAGAGGSASAATSAEAPAAPSSVSEEVRGMLAAMSQSESEVRATLQRLDDVLAQRQTPFAGSADGRARPGEDWRWALLGRVGARLRVLLEPDALAAQREAAQTRFEQGDALGARRLMLDYMQPYLARSEEASTLMNYVPRRVAADLGTTRLRALLRANGQISPQLPRIEQLEALIAAREARDDFMMAADLELSELESLGRGAYDAAFVAALTAARAKPPGALKLENRSTRCPVVSDLGPVTDAPRVNTTLSTPTAAYYPADSLANGIEGKVAVYARVTPEGCVHAAGVLVSTGVEALDAAALRWMLEGAVFSRSTPRSGGEAATTTLSVNFKGTD